MNNKKIPESLKLKQDNQRNKTIEKVQNAIDLIREEGGIVTKKRLIEITGLAATTFSKQHVKEVLEINKVCQFSKNKEIKKVDAKDERLIKQNKKLKEELLVLNNKLDEKNIAYDLLEEKYQKLLWKIHEFEQEKDIKSSTDIYDLSKYKK